MEEKYGEYAFILGVVIAIVLGVLSAQAAPYSQMLNAALAVLGLIVGLMNIKDKEVNTFLLASLVLLTSAVAIGNAFVIIPQFQTWVVGFVSALTAFVAPAAVVVALKAVYNLARS
ncbi:MAG: hypothetical protein ACP5NX_03100 [Candidatus Bilamarchaeaceae archaeon]